MACSLSLPLANSLIRRPAAPGSSCRERVQQRTDERVLDALVFGALDGARSQRVLDNLQVHTGFAGLLAHRGHLTDRGARVLGSDQGVGLGGDVRQFGDDFLLLGQIESHCTPPNELRSRLLPLAVLGRHRSIGAGDAGGVPVVAFPEKRFQKGGTICAGPGLAKRWIKRSRWLRRRFLASRASMPDVAAR